MGNASYASVVRASRGGPRGGPRAQIRPGALEEERDEMGRTEEDRR